jgi:hypothetical protein
MALGYEVVFQTPVSELFPGLRETVENGIESSLAEFESALRKQKSEAARSQVPVITRKLEWINERRELPGAKR